MPLLDRAAHDRRGVADLVRDVPRGLRAPGAGDGLLELPRPDRARQGRHGSCLPLPRKGDELMQELRRQRKVQVGSFEVEVHVPERTPEKISASPVYPPARPPPAPSPIPPLPR